MPAAWHDVSGVSVAKRLQRDRTAGADDLEPVVPARLAHDGARAERADHDHAAVWDQVAASVG